MNLAYHVIYEDAGNGVWTATIPALGVTTEGMGRSGAQAMAEDAIRGYIEGAQRRGWVIPEPDAVAVEVAAS